MTAKLVFYPLADGEAAPLVADEVRSLDPDTDEGEVIWNDSQALSYTFTDLPRNLERVYLDVHREGQRGDEFYMTSTNSAAGGRGIREFVAKVDGQPAGVVPAYPYIYTYGNGGGFQNRNWAPIPATSAFNFIGYRVDLSPFAGVLSDGNPHTVSINGHNLPNAAPVRTCVFSNVTTRFGTPATGCGYGPGGNGYVLTGGAFWYVMGNLVLYRDHGAETTGGEVTQNTLTAEPTVETTGSGQSIRRVVTHDHVISGYVDTSHGRVVTTLDQKIKLDTNITNASSTLPNQLTEYVLKTTVSNGDDTSVTTVNLNYLDQNGTLRADGRNTLGWTYSAQAEHNGNAGYWVKISDLYTTVNGSEASRQRYVAFDSAGRCYDRTLEADITQRSPAITGVFDGVACDALVAPSVELSVSPEGLQVEGREVVLTATLADQDATGLVEFFDGDDSLGTAVVVDGAASLATSSLAVGEHSVTVRYLPDLAAGGSFVASEVTVSVVVVSLDVSASVDPRMLGGKVYLSVSATNEGSVPVSVVISTEFGGKTFTNVGPGATVSVSINSRLTSVPAGEATVEVTGTVDGQTATNTTTAPYPAFPAVP
ncbi:MAG: Ig-like domain repeat protein [Propionibacteriaceae bacterium]|nr:Ig-like domain repeat protein [Propionibacteriaceae bacterium]